MDPDLWDEIGANPVRMLGALGQEKLDQLAHDDEFVGRVRAEDERLTAYLEGDRWFQRLEGDKPVHIAYFSPEFGVDGSLPQYSGGLGILAGDHLKSASDLGVPLTGVGLFYRAGYFRQSIGEDGWQREAYPLLDPYGLGLTLLRGAVSAHITRATARLVADHPGWIEWYLGPRPTDPAGATWENHQAVGPGTWELQNWAYLGWTGTNKSARFVRISVDSASGRKLESVAEVEVLAP